MSNSVQAMLNVFMRLQHCSPGIVQAFQETKYLHNVNVIQLTNALNHALNDNAIKPNSPKVDKEIFLRRTSAIVAKHIKQTSLLKLEFLSYLAPNSPSEIRILSMRHTFFLPDSVEIPTTISCRSSPLHRPRRRGTRFRSGRNVYQSHTSLLRINTEESREHRKEPDKEPSKPKLTLNLPDTCRDEARVEAVYSNVLVLLMLQESALQFVEPYLEVQLVVLIILHALRACSTRDPVEVGNIEVAQVVEARCRADHPRLLGFSQRWQKRHRE